MNKEVKRYNAKCENCSFEVYIIGEFSNIAYECHNCGEMAVHMIPDYEKILNELNLLKESEKRKN